MPVLGYRSPLKRAWAASLLGSPTGGQGFEDNIDVLRLTSLDEHDLARIKNYHSACAVPAHEVRFACGGEGQ